MIIVLLLYFTRLEIWFWRHTVNMSFKGIRDISVKVPRITWFFFSFLQTYNKGKLDLVAVSRLYVFMHLREILMGKDFMHYAKLYEKNIYRGKWISHEYLICM